MKVVRRIGSEGELGRLKSRRLRSLAFVPTLLTLGNLICGFAAIHFARAMYDLGVGVPPDQFVLARHPAWVAYAPSFLSVGAGLIVLGMLLDCFDGLVARVTRSTTNFGGQLDSLADVVTFGVAGHPHGRLDDQGAGGRLPLFRRQSATACWVGRRGFRPRSTSRSRRCGWRGSMSSTRRRTSTTRSFAGCPVPERRPS